MSKNVGTAERYLLCRPRGGLNDTLVQIERCWRYAERFDRILIIDPRFAGALTNLWLFFSPISPSSRIYFHVSPEQLQYLNELSCKPSCVSGRLLEYRSIGVSFTGGKVCCEFESKEPLQFDQEIDHSEQLLLHESWGGGTESFDFLKRVRLEANLADNVSDEIAKLGPDYAAVHVRHSDYKTDWRRFFRAIRTTLSGRTVLVCSDSFAVIAAAPLMLKDSKIIAQSDFLYIDGKPQHHRVGASEHDKNHTMRAALIDLLKLGAASELFVNVHNGGRISGYSRLAAMICQDKAILNSLMGRPIVPSYRIEGKVHMFQIVENRAVQVFNKWTARLITLARRALVFLLR